MSGLDFNTWVRRQAGREPAPPPELDERPIADFGGGRGGTCAMPRPRSTTMNDRIRAAMTLTRHATIAGGIRLDDVDVDDLLGRR
jgi:hypothetical protein